MKMKDAALAFHRWLLDLIVQLSRIDVNTPWYIEDALHMTLYKYPY